MDLNIGTVSILNNRTIVEAQFDGYDELIFTFADGERLVIWSANTGDLQIELEEKLDI